MPPNATFSHTKCSGPTIAQTGTIWILFVCLTTQINPSTVSAQPWRSLCSVEITNVYSQSCGHNIDCWVLLQLFEKVNIIVPAGKCSWNWTIQFGRVQQKYNIGTKVTLPWKVLSRSHSVCCTQMLSDWGIIPRLALVYSTLQSSPKCSTDIWQWKG